MRLLAQHRNATAIMLAALLYGLVSLLMFGSRESWLTHFVGVGADPISYIWGLNWWPWSIGHGIYPLVSRYVWYPAGFHMAWSDSAPSAALIGLPLILAGNAVLAYNVLMIAAPAASATCAFVLARYLTRDTIASLFAGYFFGFSTYQIGHGFGHLSLVLTFLVPIVVLLALKRIAGEISRRSFIGLLAICLLIQFGFTMEIFATVCVFGAIAWAIGFVFAPPQLRRHMIVVALEILVAAAIVVVIITPWLISLYRGRGDVPNVINDPNWYGTDLLNFLVPDDLTWLRNSLSARIAGSFRNLAENSGYIGLPLIAILILRWRESWRSPVGRILLCLTVLFAALSLGPRLVVGGVHIPIWMPSQILLYLPLIRHALPGRFSMFVALTTAIVAAYWFAAAQTRLGRAGRYALGILAVIALLPNLAMTRWSAIPFVPFFDRQNVERAVGRNANLVMLPFLDAPGIEGPSMIWQWQSGMAFTQSGGYVGQTPPHEASWAAVQSFNRGIPSADFGNDVRAYAATHQVDAIVAGPGTQRALLDGLDKLGWKQEQTEGVRLYHVPDLAGLSYYSVTGQFWPGTETEIWGWIGSSATIYAAGADYTVDIRGNWRPKTVGPATVAISQDGKTTTSVIDPKDGLQIPLAAGHRMTLTSSSLFVPGDFFGGSDKRELSVMLRVTPR